MGTKNKVVLTLVLFVFLSASIGVLSQEKQKANKIGFADFLTIYHSYSATKVEDERLKEKGTEFQTQIDTEKVKIAELEKKMGSGVLSEEEKGKLSKEIEEAKTQISKKIQEFNLEIESDRRQTIDKLIGELRDKISVYGKEKGYSIILDKNQLIFSDTNLDITQEIVEYVNKESNQGTQKPNNSSQKPQK